MNNTPVLDIAAPAMQGALQSLSPLKYQRLLRGWSQQDVVNEIFRLFGEDEQLGLGLCAETVSRWENGRRKPAPLYKKQLCRLYGMNALELGIF